MANSINDPDRLSNNIIHVSDHIYFDCSQIVKMVISWGVGDTGDAMLFIIWHFDIGSHCLWASIVSGILRGGACLINRASFFNS